MAPYDDAARAPWRHEAVDRGDAEAVQRALVRYATLAPSSHNTPCWKFRIEPGDGAQSILRTDKPARERTAEFVVQGNSAQMNDQAFVDGLKAWIRFCAGDAVRLGDGLYTASSGNPSVRSSTGIAVCIGPANDTAGSIAAGRACERFALQATALGVRTAHLNQPIEVAALRSSCASALGVNGWRPDRLVRFGRGPTLPPALRRPLQAVLL